MLKKLFDGTAIVEYTFADGSHVLIPMMDANFNGRTDSANGDLPENDSETAISREVWILDLAVWNAGA